MRRELDALDLFSVLEYSFSFLFYLPVLPFYSCYLVLAVQNNKA